MDDKEEQYQEDINIKLGGMGVYGTASHKFGSRKTNRSVQEVGKLDEYEKVEENDLETDTSKKAGEEKEY
ncbi:hypothetical protein [Piscibacillus salipiscarius]|uniref:DUF4025 domain-containing protein n=1 Tax=Piscibacillus salipiscarius TaxID=299480 RepID=A0ABW5QD80_9BACI|nr:hypothetical protein [Piscibacillus salipiscarius]